MPILLYPSIALFLFLGVRNGMFGHKTMAVPHNITAFVVRDPICDYLMMPDEPVYYRWSVRPIAIIKN